MSQVSRLGGCFLGLALLAGGSAAAAGKRADAAPAAPTAISPAARPSTPSATPTAVVTTPIDVFWTPLPSRFATSWGGAEMMRIEWDRESGTWGPASSGLSPLGAGVFGARLPSDRPVQITRADGAVMLMLGPEGMEFLTARLGRDGRFHLSCGPDAHPVGEPTAPLEDR